MTKLTDTLKAEMNAIGVHKKKDRTINFNLRLTPTLHKALAEAARKNYRSISKEIMLRLYKSLEL